MKHHFILILLLYIVSSPAYATAAPQTTRKQTRLFGEEAGHLYQAFLDIHITKEEVIPGEPARRTVIRNRETYYQVRSIEKELTRQIKKKSISQSEASTRFIQILRTAIQTTEHPDKTDL